MRQAFIDDHRGDYGVEPICKVLPIDRPTYHDHVAKHLDPSRHSARAKRDEGMKLEVRRTEHVGIARDALSIVAARNRTSPRQWATFTSTG
jgi:hypothetical protein